MTIIGRREALVSGLALGLVPAARAIAGPPAGPPVTEGRWRLWYAQPARRWVEALPIGNGRLGAMLYGGAARERIQLNDDSFWAGGPYDPSSPAAREALPRVRQLIWEGKFAEAQALVQSAMMARPLTQMAYQTIGELLFEMPGQAPPSAYRRWLDIDNASHVVEWESDGRRFRRTAYASAPDQVIALTIEALDGGPFTATLRFAKGGAADGQSLRLEGANDSQDGIAGRLTFVARCARRRAGRVGFEQRLPADDRSPGPRDRAACGADELPQLERCRGRPRRPAWRATCRLRPARPRPSDVPATGPITAGCLPGSTSTWAPTPFRTSRRTTASDTAMPSATIRIWRRSMCNMGAIC